MGSKVGGNMNKLIKVLLIRYLCIVLVIFGLLAIVASQPSLPTQDVIVAMHLGAVKQDGSDWAKQNPIWYWTEFHLPPGGELMVEELDKTKWEESNANGLAKKVSVGHWVFHGTYCCGDPLDKGLYIFLPTQAFGKEAKNLLFFDPNGSVWVLPLPEKLRTPQIGELIIKAMIYSSNQQNASSSPTK